MRINAQPILEEPITNARGVNRCRYYTDFMSEARNVRDLGAREKLNLAWFNGSDSRFNGPVFVLHKNGNVVGFAELDNTAWAGMARRFYVSTLFIRKEYRGRKLATVLHLGALHVFGKLASDTNLAAGAVAAFRSLAKYGYNVKLLDTDKHKDVDYSWSDDGIPIVYSVPMTELDTQFVLYV